MTFLPSGPLRSGPLASRLKWGPGPKGQAKRRCPAWVTCTGICSWENLRFAHHRASRGKRGREAAAAFEYNLADNLAAAQICAPEKAS